MYILSFARNERQVITDAEIQERRGNRELGLRGVFFFFFFFFFLCEGGGEGLGFRVRV